MSHYLNIAAAERKTVARRRMAYRQSLYSRFVLEILIYVCIDFRLRCKYVFDRYYRELAGQPAAMILVGMSADDIIQSQYIFSNMRR